MLAAPWRRAAASGSTQRTAGRSGSGATQTPDRIDRREWVASGSGGGHRCGPSRGAAVVAADELGAREQLATWLGNQVQETRLLPNYPNPFNPETWFPYELSTDANVAIHIYDMHAQRIRVLDLGHRKAGVYLSKHSAVHWDGRNQTGEAVASGVYFYRLQAGGFTALRRMLVLK